MNTQQLQKKVEELVDKGYKYFALQDRPGKVVKINCGRFWPSAPKGNGWGDNSADAVANLAKYVQQYPDYYVLNVARVANNGWEQIEVDTRPAEEQHTKPQTIAEPMDERTKEERRNDELTIRTLMAQNASLEAEVKRLAEKIEELEADLDAAEAEAEENKHAQMADATTSTIGQLAQVLPELVDKYFRIQEQKNALLAEQMMRQRPPMRPPQPDPTHTGPQNTAFDYEI
jgi:hypothetical protein